MRLRWTIWSIAALLTLALAGPSLAATGWTVPSAVSPRVYYELSAAVDQQGHVNAVAERGNAIWYITNRTGSWTRARIFQASAGQAVGSPSIAEGTDGSTHIAFDYQQCTYDTCGLDWPYYSQVRYTDDVGRTPGKFRPSTTLDTGSGSPSIAVAGGRVYVAYQFYTPSGTDIEFLQSDRPWSSWSFGVVTSTGAASTPSLKVGSDGRAQIAFDDFGIPAYAEGNLDNTSFTWSDILAGPATGDEVNPRLALGPGDVPVVAWTQVSRRAADAGTWVSRLSRGTWHSTRATADSGLNALAFTEDGLARPVLAFDTPSGIEVVQQMSGLWSTRKVASGSEIADCIVFLGANGKARLMFSADGGASVGTFVSSSK